MTDRHRDRHPDTRTDTRTAVFMEVPPQLKDDADELGQAQLQLEVVV